MYIDSITNGIVIDHIKAGKAMEIYKILGLEKLDCPVAIIKNVHSGKMGKKDIIKVDSDIDIDLDAIGYVDSEITINVIKDGKIIEKKHIELPLIIKNIVRCKNPRCITTTEQELDHVFKLTNREEKTYRCIYCESKVQNN